jgi:integrase/transcriptional regulator with XRE-family HTH domain
MDMRTTPSNDADTIQQQPAITYQDLINQLETLGAGKEREQQQRNQISALRKFLAYCGLDVEFPVGEELTTSFPEVLKDFLGASDQQGLSKGSQANLRTHLNAWHTLYRDLCLQQVMKFDSLAAALNYYLRLAREQNPLLTQRGLAQLTSISENTLSQWILGDCKFPSIKQHAGLCRLEQQLNAPEATFSQFIFDRTSKTAPSKQTEFGEKIRALRATPYALQVRDFSEPLRQEIRHFVNFKTGKIAPNGLKRNEVWRLAASECVKFPNKDYQDLLVIGNQAAASANIFVSAISSFFGSLKNLGFDPSCFSLAYLSDASLIERYLTFMAERQNGVLTKTAMQIVIYATSLLLTQTIGEVETDTGFLIQQPHFSALLPTPIAPDAWRSWCIEQRRRIKHIDHELRKGGHIKTGRDIRGDTLSYWIEKDRPLEAVWTCLDRMRENFDAEGDRWSIHERMAFKRDYLLMTLMPIQPLRAKMWEIMTLKKDNRGNLRKLPSGQYQISFKPEDFKNQKGAAKDKPYDVPFPLELTPLIDDYLENVRPYFLNGRDLDNVFMPIASNHKIAKKRGWLYGAIRGLFMTYVPEAPAMGPHAIRHLVATHYIKNNPSGFQIAADVLHDRLDTVLKAYAHLRAKDGHLIYQTFYAAELAARRKAA